MDITYNQKIWNIIVCKNQNTLKEEPHKPLFNTLRIVIPPEVTLDLFFLVVLFCLFLLFLISRFVHITCPLSDEGRMFHFIKTLFEKLQVIKFNNTVIIKVRYILFDKYTVVLQLLGTSCWYRDNCITKLWDLRSYFIYLHMVFFQRCFRLEQHGFTWIDSFHVLQTFQTDWFESLTQSSLVINNSCSSD